MSYGRRGSIVMGVRGRPYYIQHQADAVLNQAAPVQNTWYTVLAVTEDVRIIIAEAHILVANEDLQMRITIDGNVILFEKPNAAFGTFYTAQPSPGYADYGDLDVVTVALNRAFLYEGQSVLIELRKTSANGAGNLCSRVKWARLMPT